MSDTTKTDNGDLRAKLDLRRYFLAKYHADDPPRVLDCCQGSGLIWSRLRAEFQLGGYWGIDLKPKRGRLKLDSVRVLEQPGWRQNVIDIDTYGSPWKHWTALLPNAIAPLTVFLTIGSTMHAGSLGAAGAESMGITFRKLDLPVSFGRALSPLSLIYCLDQARGHGFELAEVVEALSRGNARYLGIRLNFGKSSPPAVKTESTQA